MPGLLPADVRAMTPVETDLLVQGWNEAQSDGTEAPTDAEYEALVAKYG